MSILLNISSADATNVTSTTQYSYTFTQWQSFHSMNLVNACISNVQYNVASGNNTITISGTTYTISLGSYSISVLLALLNATISGITATYSSTNFRVTFTGNQALLFLFLKASLKFLGSCPTPHTQPIVVL